MKKVFAVFALLCSLVTSGQTSFIGEKLRMDKLDSLGENIYNAIARYQLIMVGEIHGTNEPPLLVTGLAELLAAQGDSIQVGFEIPSELMGPFLGEHTDSSVFNSEFFQRGFNDGRSSVAMANAIARLGKNPKVEVFFYDINTGDEGERDSLMYLKVKERILKHPHWKTITLSGNIHNQLLPHRTGKKMGWYLANDHTLKAARKLCSLNQNYQSGTARNNTGNGLQLHKLGYEDPYSTRSGIDNYLLLFPQGAANAYTGIYFTRHVTAAEMVTNSKAK